MTYKCGHMSGTIWIGNDASAIFPCCHTTAKGKQQYHHREYTDLLNHPNLVEVREAALRGEVHDLCSGCKHLEDQGLASPRTRSNTRFNNQGQVNSHIEPEDVEQLYFSLGNICNFKCVMCSGGNSHLIAKEEGWRNPNVVVDDAFLDDLKTQIARATNIRKVQISGGEPFQHRKRLAEILDIMPACAELYIHTNGSHMDEGIIEMLKSNQDFKKINIAFSIDGAGGVFDYQRTGGSWDQVVQNIISFRQEFANQANIVGSCNYTVTCLNLHTIPFFVHNVAKLFDHVGFNELTYPAYYNIRMIRPSYLEEAYESIYQLETDHDGIAAILKAIDHALDNPPAADLVRQFWQRTAYMSQVRGIDLDEKIPNARKFLRNE